MCELSRMPLSSSSVPARPENVVDAMVAASNGFPVLNSGSRDYWGLCAPLGLAAVLPSPTARAIASYDYPSTTGIATAIAMAAHATMENQR